MFFARYCCALMGDGLVGFISWIYLALGMMELTVSTLGRLNIQLVFIYLFIYLFTYFSGFFRAAPVAYGNSQSRGPVRASAAGLCHSSWHCWILNPLSEARDQTHIFMDTSQIPNRLSHNRNSLNLLLKLGLRSPVAAQQGKNPTYCW